MSTNQYPILIGGVGLIKGRIKNIGQAMASVCEEVRPLIEQKSAFENMPFDEINMIIRWGDKKIEPPEIGPLRNKTKSLDVATTISLSDGKALENDLNQLELLVKEELVKVLKAIEEKYGLCHIDI